MRSLFTFCVLAVATVVGAVGHAKFHHHHDEKKGFQAGFKAVGYYVSWAIYGRNWPPQNLQTQALTHILYAFAGLSNTTGAAYLTDPYADIQYLFPTDPAANSTSSTDLYGNLKQLYLLKKNNRNLKTLLSIGGWTLRTNFAPALTNSTVNRRRFAKSSVGLLRDLGFDGLDIDWEYPKNDLEAAALVDTVRLFREELDSYARNISGNPHFLLTLAVPAGPDNFQYFDVPGLNQYADMLHLMAYDYQGSAFSNFSGHNSNLYKSELNPRSTDYDTQTAVDYYLGNGLPAEKLNLGMPLYGRSFANTSGPGTRFTPAPDGSWEAGAWDYKALPLNGSKIYFDNDIVASWGYGGTGNHSRYMVSYDEPAIAARKAEYIHNNGMGGAMWWETSGDRPLNDSRSLIRTVTDYFKGCGTVEYCENVLDYPHSKYANLRAGMPGE